MKQYIRFIFQYSIMWFESWKKTTLLKPVSPWDTTIYLASVPTVTSGRLYIKNDAQEEWIDYTWISGNGVTGCTRLLSKTADPATGGTWLTRVAWTVVKLVAMHDQLPDKTWNNTRTGTQTFTQNITSGWTITASWTVTTPDIRFSWTTTSGLRVKSLTTTQRLALTPVNGDVVYDSTLWVLYQYIGGAWSTFATGSVVSADTTTAGKVEISTQTETEDQTTTWWTWATVVPTNATINPNNITSATPATWDKLAFADISNSNKLRSATLQSIVDTGRPLATNAEASTWSWTTQSITPVQLKKYFWPEPSAWTTYTAAIVSWSFATVNSTNGTYAQNKIWTIARAGTYTVAVTIGAVAFGTQGYARIYKNGVAFSSEQTNATWSPVTVTWDLAYTEGDTISLRIKSNWWWSSSVGFSDLTIKYDLVNQNAFTLA